MSKRRKHDLYYLLPGQGRGARRRYFRNLVVAIIIGLLAAGLLVWFIYSFAQ